MHCRIVNQSQPIMAKQIKPVSSVIYRGPSLIDGAPIVVVALTKTTNRKTGTGMVQTYVIREDVSPMEASRTGMDYSICGDCIHRGTPTSEPGRKIATGRTCYTNLAQGITQVYKALKAGKYPTATPEQVTAIGAGRMVRLGTYGDPLAVPPIVFERLLEQSIGHTGYSHNGPVHGGKDNPMAARMMVSADNAEQAVTAHKAGFRTFRVIPVALWKEQVKESLLNNEILCPASDEAGNKTTCDSCGLCAGNDTKTSKSIAIVAHGTNRNAYK